MAGCYGNHPIDRYLEGQLNRHLEAISDYDNYCEKVLKLLPENVYDFADSSEVEQILQDSYLPFHDPIQDPDEYRTVADKIIAAYNEKYNITDLEFENGNG